MGLADDHCPGGPQSVRTVLNHSIRLNPIVNSSTAPRLSYLTTRIITEYELSSHSRVLEHRQRGSVGHKHLALFKHKAPCCLSLIPRKPGGSDIMARGRQSVHRPPVLE